MNREKWWFKRRRYGWGWYPVTLQGWSVTLAYMIAVVSLGVWSPPWMLPVVAVLTVLLFLICIQKGPAPRWRWGESDYDVPEDDF